jgi:cell division protein FtsA
MKRNNYTCGIDIGTHTIRVVVIGYDKNKKTSGVLATSYAYTDGMRLGYVTNINSVAESIQRVVRQAEETSGLKIREAVVSIGGISLGSIVSVGSVVISKADQEITQLDISKALANSEENLEITNKKIIHVIPIGYKLDGNELHARPLGMHGVTLEVKTLFITCLKQNIEDIITAFTMAKIDVKDIIASPLASGTILLNQKQKAAGCALIDIGAETVSIACFENNVLISLQVFPIGSMNITKDVALNFKIDLDEAESLKLGSVIGGDYSKKKVDEIIEARLGDIFELIEKHLKRLGRNALLPAGVIITGGGAQINNIEEIAKSQLKLPARVGPIDLSLINKFKIRDTSWYTAFGLALSKGEDSSTNIHNSIGDNAGEIKRFFKSILSQLLP